MANATSYTGAAEPAVCLRCQRGPTFHGGHKKDDPLCVCHGQGDVNGGRALAFLRQQRAARGEGRLRQPPGDETQTERRPPRATLASDHDQLQPRTSLSGTDIPESAEPSRDVRLPRALLPSNRDLLQPLTSQRGTTSQGRLDRPPKQPEQSPHRGRQLPGTRLPVLQRCGENVEAAEIKTLSEDSRGKHKKCVRANLVHVCQGGFCLCYFVYSGPGSAHCTPLHTTVPTSGDALTSPPFRSVPSKIVETTLTTPIIPPNLGIATDDPPCKPPGIVERRPLLFHSFRTPYDMGLR